MKLTLSSSLFPSIRAQELTIKDLLTHKLTGRTLCQGKISLICYNTSSQQELRINAAHFLVDTLHSLHSRLLYPFSVPLHATQWTINPPSSSLMSLSLKSFSYMPLPPSLPLYLLIVIIIILMVFCNLYSG